MMKKFPVFFSFFSSFVWCVRVVVGVVFRSAFNQTFSLFLFNFLAFLLCPFRLSFFFLFLSLHRLLVSSPFSGLSILFFLVLSFFFFLCGIFCYERVTQPFCKNRASTHSPKVIQVSLFTSCFCKDWAK